MIMPHGANQVWNDAIERMVAPLKTAHQIEMAFGMGDPASSRTLSSDWKPGISGELSLCACTRSRVISRTARTIFLVSPLRRNRAGMAAMTARGGSLTGAKRRVVRHLRRL